MIINKTKIVDNVNPSKCRSKLTEKITLNTKTKMNIKNKNNSSEENNHACF